MSFWCWRCMRQQVDKPLLLCPPCARNETRKVDRLLADKPAKTERHHRSYLDPDATEEDYEAGLEKDSYRRWQEATDGHG